MQLEKILVLHLYSLINKLWKKYGKILLDMRDCIR